MRSMMQLTSLALMLLALPACVTTSVYAERSACSELIADIWTDPVPDAAAPVEGATALDTLKSWINFGVAQTAGKRSEFERAQAARGIIARCEERDRKAVQRSKPFLGIF